MTTKLKPGATALAAVAASTLLLTGCVPNAGSDAAGAVIDVTANDDGCDVSVETGEAGPITFRVTNEGTKVNEFYLLAENRLTIIGEVENIAPGGTRDLTVIADPGSFFTECKPGMIGAGVGTAAFTVTGEAQKIDPESQAVIDEAVLNYVAYVKSQTEQLLPAVEEFVAAYTSGDDEEAKRLFPIARTYYERIEPTAEQFGDLDPKIDYRKPGAEEEGIPFTGFHRIEMDLWIDNARANYPDETIEPLSQTERDELGKQLVENVTELKDLVASPEFTLTLSDITNGAIGLLDEVAAPDGKLPGEEDEFSHTDLYDFWANVEGAQVAFDSVRRIASAQGEEGAALVEEIDAQFEAMFALLEEYGNPEEGFVDYSTVTDAQRNELGSQLQALAEPISHLTNTVLGLPGAE